MTWLRFVVLAGLIWTGPKLTPEEAARILAKAPGISNRTGICECLPPGPRVVIVPSSAQPPFGNTFVPARRLDGTDRDSPPALYGPSVIYAPFPVLSSAPGWAWPFPVSVVR